MGLRSEQDVRDLEADWHEYVERTLRLQSSRGLELAAVAALRTDRPIRAKRLFQEAIDQGSTNPVTFHKYAEVLLEEGDTRAAVEQWQRAIALDPLNASFHMGLSYAQAKLEDATESRRLAALAREIDPDVE
jgi:Flp pilus assembly protein TadD